MTAADGLAVLGDASQSGFGLLGTIFVSSNLPYRDVNNWGAIYRDTQTDPNCILSTPQGIIQSLDLPGAVALGDVDAAGEEGNGSQPFALYFAQRTNPSENLWTIYRVRDPSRWYNWEQFGPNIRPGTFTLALDPHCDGLFAGRLTDVLRTNAEGALDTFLSGLDSSGGGLTFTWSGILVVSEAGRLVGVDGWRYRFKRGDANRILGWLFYGWPEAPCWDAADVNDDAAINISDPIYLLNFLFQGGPEPPPPFQSFGVDPSPDLFGCREYLAAQKIPWIPRP